MNTEINLEMLGRGVVNKDKAEETYNQFWKKTFCFSQDEFAPALLGMINRC